jgi:hypothetical protein
MSTRVARLVPLSLAPLAAIPTTVVVALIAAASGLIGAFVNALLTRRNTAAQARISYNYEARKRLYAVCEPLLFQATEQAVEASARIRGLANTARDGHLRLDGSGWLDAPEKYFFRSTVYNLLAPLTSFSILQRRLTTVDLSLDTAVRAKYEMLKLIFFSFKSDWKLAKWSEGTALEYDRNRTDPGEPERERLLRDSPQCYAPQGLYRAMLYVVAEAFVRRDDDRASGAIERCITFGEFQREWNPVEARRTSRTRRSLSCLGRGRATASLEPVFDPLVELFAGFHPQRKPVLWRVLVSQYLLYRALFREEPEFIPLGADEIEAFDWRSGTEHQSDFRQSLLVAEGFVAEQLSQLRERLELN